MDAEIKERWLTALESGKYRKGRSNLVVQGGRMCCIGVLCDIIDPRGWYYGKHLSNNDHSLWENGERFDAVTGVSPHDVRFSELAALNDREPGYPVDYIEENF